HTHTHTHTHTKVGVPTAQSSKRSIQSAKSCCKKAPNTVLSIKPSHRHTHTHAQTHTHTHTHKHTHTDKPLTQKMFYYVCLTRSYTHRQPISPTQYHMQASPILTVRPTSLSLTTSLVQKSV